RQEFQIMDLRRGPRLSGRRQDLAHRDVLHWRPLIPSRYCSPSFETAAEPVIGRASARPVGGLTKQPHAEERAIRAFTPVFADYGERLEAWATSDSLTSHSQS